MKKILRNIARIICRLFFIACLPIVIPMALGFSFIDLAEGTEQWALKRVWELLTEPLFI